MPDSDLVFDIHLKETSGVSRVIEPVRTGVPLPRGWLPSTAEASLCDADGREATAQFKALAYWSDRSIKWLLVDALVSVAANGNTRLTLSNARSGSRRDSPSVSVKESANLIEVDTGAICVRLAKRGGSPINSVSARGSALLDSRGLRLRATGGDG